MMIRYVALHFTIRNDKTITTSETHIKMLKPLTKQYERQVQFIRSRAIVKSRTEITKDTNE